MRIQYNINNNYNQNVQVRQRNLIIIKMFKLGREIWIILI